MKAPKNEQDFYELIDSMLHRERFKFELVNNSSIEVYSTYLESGKKNICLTLITKGISQKPQNRLFELWDKNDIKKFYSLLKK
jgi:hypothetical protein